YYIAMTGQEFAQDGIVLERRPETRMVNHQGELSRRCGGIADAWRGYVKQLVNQEFFSVGRFALYLLGVERSNVVRECGRKLGQRRLSRLNLQVGPMPHRLAIAGRLRGIPYVDENWPRRFACRIRRLVAERDVVPARVI